MSVSRGVYLTHVDRDLGLRSVNRSPVNHEELRAMLVLYSLLNEWLVIPDGASFYNLVLRDLLQDKAHRHFGLAKLLQDGVIVPIARDVAPTFVELEAFLFASGAWRAPPRDISRPWAEFLDENTTSRLVLNHEVAAQLFSESTFEVVHDPLMAERLGLKGLRDALLGYVETREKEYENGFARRSTLYEFADLLPIEDARSARQARVLGSALYHLTAARALNLQCAMAGPYAAIFGELNGLPPNMRGVINDTERASSSAASLLSFDPAHLARIDYEVISDIRRSKAFHDYLDQMEAARTDFNPANAAERAQQALVAYLGYLEEPLFIAAGGRQRQIRRLRRRATAYSTLSTVGGLATSLVGLVVPGSELAAFAGGLFWLFGGALVNNQIDTRTKEEIVIARTELLTSKLEGTAFRGLPSLSRPLGSDEEPQAGKHD